MDLARAKMKVMARLKWVDAHPDYRGEVDEVATTLLAEVLRLTANEVLWKAQNEDNAAENKRLEDKSWVSFVANVKLSKEVGGRTADAERYREALESIAANIPAARQNTPVSYLQGIAREALATAPAAGHGEDGA